MRPPPPSLSHGGSGEMKTNRITPHSLPARAREPGQAGWVGWGPGGEKGESHLIHCKRLDVQQQLRGGLRFLWCWLYLSLVPCQRGGFKWHPAVGVRGYRSLGASGRNKSFPTPWSCMRRPLTFTRNPISMTGRTTCLSTSRASSRRAMSGLSSA